MPARVAAVPVPATASRTGTALIELVLDPGSYTSWDEPIEIGHLPPAYQAELRRAAERSGTDESVLTGQGEIGGRPVAVIVGEFRFLGGSVGSAAADRIVKAIRRATVERLPILASTSSGGTRLQEGTPAFLRMIDITRAVAAHRAAGCAYLVHLRHPTTGGVYASWGSLGQATIAEPGALVGFLGPKVYRQLTGSTFPSGVQTAQNLATHGVIDGLVRDEELRQVVDRTLAVVVDRPIKPRLERRPLCDGQHAQSSARLSIERTRARRRAGVRDLLRHGGGPVVCLRGTQAGERDDTVVVALTRLDGQPCVVVGQDRARQRSTQLGPGALRQARRGMQLAAELRLPLVTVVDTPGAELSPQSEEGALAGEIARSIATLTSMTVPTIAILLGQGCGGGALALLPAKHVVAAEHAWLAALPLAGASTILTGSAAATNETTEQQRIRSRDLHETGAVHAVVPERDDDTVRSLSRALIAHTARTLSDGHAPCGR